MGEARRPQTAPRRGPQPAQRGVRTRVREVLSLAFEDAHAPLGPEHPGPFLADLPKEIIPEVPPAEVPQQLNA